ncbi:MAG: helix-turn-helix transcriptional regulator, partial [Muribaculaceae bacterium]
MVTANNAVNRLRVILAEKNKTNRWLAEAIGKNENTISRWCSNKSQPSVDVVVEIARVLDVDIRDLFNVT